MTATLIVRHKVNDYMAWRSVFDELEPLRAQHGCTNKRVLRLPEDGNDVLITHDFHRWSRRAASLTPPSCKLGWPGLVSAGPPQVEIFTAV